MSMRLRYSIKRDESFKGRHILIWHTYAFTIEQCNRDTSASVKHVQQRVFGGEEEVLCLAEREGEAIVPRPIIAHYKSNIYSNRVAGTSMSWNRRSLLGW